MQVSRFSPPHQALSPTKYLQNICKNICKIFVKIFAKYLQKYSLEGILCKFPDSLPNTKHCRPHGQQQLVLCAERSRIQLWSCHTVQVGTCHQDFRLVPTLAGILFTRCQRPSQQSFLPGRTTLMTLLPSKLLDRFRGVPNSNIARGTTYPGHGI